MVVGGYQAVGNGQRYVPGIIIDAMRVEGAKRFLSFGLLVELGLIQRLFEAGAVGQYFHAPTSTDGTAMRNATVRP